MITNYLIYLNTLSKEAKFEQILMIISFFLIILAICGILEFLKTKFMVENKNSLFQKLFKNI